jgi:hypothetical protein
MATAAYNDVLSKIVNLLPTGAQTQITAADHRQVEVALLEFAEKQWLTGDLKEIDCNNTYIQNNFIMTGPDWGLGIGEREGWAICNGNNGTRNRTGRASIAWGITGMDENNLTIVQPNMTYGTTQEIPVTLGTRRQSLNESEIPAHSHPFQHRVDSSSYGDNFTPTWTPSTDEGTWSGINQGGLGGANSFRVLDTGGGQPHNNMQPSIVTLFIQKIPTP